jgi:acetyl esterase/lipase
MLFYSKLFFYLFLLFVTLFLLNSFARANDITVLSDIAYGESEEQVFDVYYSSDKKQDAPVIFMVHGGAWRIGDKASKSVVKNKVAHWVPKGFIFISVNYRMLPDIQPVEQAEDVARALIFVQQNAFKWGGSAEKVILMGHSAGAHLVSLVSVKSNTKIKPWLGTIALDSAAYDVDKIMSSHSPAKFYKKAFGHSRAYWKKASPVYVLANKLPPFLAVCSSIRKGDSCLQAGNFVEKAKRYGTRAQLMPVALSHRKVNMKLGRDFCYTQKVNAFIKQLHPSFVQMLTSHSSSHLRHSTQKKLRE